MAECLSKTDELGKEGLLRERVHSNNLELDVELLEQFHSLNAANQRGIIAALSIFLSGREEAASDHQSIC